MNIQHELLTQNFFYVQCSFTSLFIHGKSLEIETTIMNVNYLK